MRALLVSAVLAAQAASAIDVARLAIAPPTVVCDLDPSVVKGEIRRLSWSNDGAYLHIQTRDGDALRDFIVSIAGREVSVAFGEPEWGARYWAVKSSLAAPGDPALKIDVLEDHQRTRPAPFNNGFGPNGGQTVDPRNPVDTFAIEVKLKLLGEEIGYFFNDVAYGGLTFGWGPTASGALAFVDDKGRVTLLDRAKHKRVVPDAKDAALPAWSPDGTRIAFVQKTARKQRRLMMAALSSGS